MSPTAVAKRGSAPDAKAAPARQISFRSGVQSHDEINYDVTPTMTTSTQDLAVLNIPPAGFLRYLWLLVETFTSGNAATVAFQSDGPFSAIDTITLEDVNSAPIVGPFSGFDLYLVNKFGGYAFNEDPRNSPVYTATTGSGGTGGSFTFCLRIPIELVNRDALGALTNKSGSSLFKLRIRLAPSTSVYSTAPTTLPPVRVRVQQVAWWDPDATDLKGRPISQTPPAVGTTQFWSKATYQGTAGSWRQPHERVGYDQRALIFILRDSTNARTDADWPDPFNIQIDANVLRTKLAKIWQHEISQLWGYSAARGSVNGGDVGVYVEPFHQDFELHPGAETRRGYLETSSATRQEFFGTIGGSGLHTVTVLTNDVAPIRDYQEIVAG